MQLISRKGSFDSGHRVMNEKFKCYNIHGHTYLYELNFEFNDMMDIGYAIDFKEIKRVGCQWIDDYLDHGMILNPKDDLLITTAKQMGSKYWIMSLNGGGYCNPTAENIAREICLAQQILFEKHNGLYFHSLRLYETPNCWTDCYLGEISDKEKENFNTARSHEIRKYAAEKGIIEYDCTKI